MKSSFLLTLKVQSKQFEDLQNIHTKVVLCESWAEAFEKFHVYLLELENTYRNQWNVSLYRLEVLC